MIKWYIILCLAGSMQVHAQAYQSVEEGSSSVNFKIRNMGSNVDGTFSNVKGRIRFNPDSLASSDFNISVSAATIDTGIGMRDKHLRKEDYFDVETHPEISHINDIDG